MIERIITRELTPPDGIVVFETTVFLREWDKLFQKSSLYGNASGAGTSKNQWISVLKGCSEAIERAALIRYRDTKMHGMSYNKTSTGMAAYPGFLAIQARKLALCEAIERWAVIEWWNGRLRHQIIGHTSDDKYFVQILHPFSNAYLVVFVYHDEDGLVRYGFGCASKLDVAKEKAKVEAFRNLRLDFDKDVSTINEKRAKHFSQGEGLKLFIKRLKTQPIVGELEVPKLEVDSEIVGEWSSYCTVWRCLIIPNNGFPPDDDLDVFIF